MGLSVSADHEYVACAVPESPNVPLWKLAKPDQASELAAALAAHASKCDRWRSTPRSARAGKRQRWDIDDRNDERGAVRGLVEEVVEEIVAGLREGGDGSAEERRDRAETIEFELRGYGRIRPLGFGGS